MAGKNVILNLIDNGVLRKLVIQKTSLFRAGELFFGFILSLIISLFTKKNNPTLEI